MTNRNIESMAHTIGVPEPRGRGSRIKGDTNIHLLMAYDNGWSLSQISQAVGVSVSSVKAAIARNEAARRVAIGSTTVRTTTPGLIELWAEYLR